MAMQSLWHDAAAILAAGIAMSLLCAFKHMILRRFRRK